MGASALQLEGVESDGTRVIDSCVSSDQHAGKNKTNNKTKKQKQKTPGSSARAVNVLYC